MFLFLVQIRGACFKVVSSLCQQCEEFVGSQGRLFCPLVLSSLGEREPGVVGPLWEAAILTTSSCQVRLIYRNPSTIAFSMRGQWPCGYGSVLSIIAFSMVCVVCL